MKLDPYKIYKQHPEWHCRHCGITYKEMERINEYYSYYTEYKSLVNAHRFNCTIKLKYGWLIAKDSVGLGYQHIEKPNDIFQYHWIDTHLLPYTIPWWYFCYNYFTFYQSKTNIWRIWKRVIKPRIVAAKVIQKHWRLCISNPNYIICKKRLEREFLELS